MLINKNAAAGISAAALLYKENHALDAWYNKAYGVEHKNRYRYYNENAQAVTRREKASLV
jgi:hypothetical protein